MKRACGITAGLDTIVAPRADADTAARLKEAFAVLARAGQSYWEIEDAEALTGAVGVEALRALAAEAGVRLIRRLPFVPGETPETAVERAVALAAGFDAVILSDFRRYAAEADGAVPGAAVLKAVKAALKGKELFADDTDASSPVINKLLSENGLACTRVLENGFAGRDPSNRDLIHNFPATCLAYLSAPGGEGIMRFLYRGDPLDVGFAVDYLNLSEREGYAYGFLRGLLASPAALVLIPARDIPSADGTLAGAEPGRLRYYTRLFGRCAK